MYIRRRKFLLEIPVHYTVVQTASALTVVTVSVTVALSNRLQEQFATSYLR
jgi:hypothetical protein